MNSFPHAIGGVVGVACARHAACSPSRLQGIAILDKKICSCCSSSWVMILFQEEMQLSGAKSSPGPFDAIGVLHHLEAQRAVMQERRTHVRDGKARSETEGLMRWIHSVMMVQNRLALTTR
jgi:hypothetical protein